NHRGTEKRTPRLSCVKALILEIRVRPRHPRLRKSAFLPRIRVHWRAFAVERLRSGSWILASKFSRFQFVSIRGWKRIIKLSDFQIGKGDGAHPDTSGHPTSNGIRAHSWWKKARLIRGPAARHPICMTAVRYCSLHRLSVWFCLFPRTAAFARRCFHGVVIGDVERVTAVRVVGREIDGERAGVRCARS